MSYLSWNTKIVTDFKKEPIDSLYEQGYVATRVDKGIFNQTRSMRVRLSAFSLSSENRRILRKCANLKMTAYTLPYRNYHWSIHKMAKDFYTTKFGADTFSANKIKELMTEPNKSNFTTVLVYRDAETDKAIGYAICLVTETMIHYSYPFYTIEPVAGAGVASGTTSTGLGMMIGAIVYAKEKGLKYAYLGSLQRPSDTYKLQFSGTEWFDGSEWQTDTAPLKEVLKQ